MPNRSPRLRQWVCVILLLCAPDIASAQVTRGGYAAFDIESYFHITRFKEVVISSDGNKVVLATSKALLEADRTQKEFWWMSIRKSNALMRLDLPEDARKLQWISDSNEIAYVSGQGRERPQIHAVNVYTGMVRRLTDMENSVVNYRYSPDEEVLAFVSTLPKEKGVFVDPCG